MKFLDDCQKEDEVLSSDTFKEETISTIKTPITSFYIDSTQQRVVELEIELKESKKTIMELRDVIKANRNSIIDSLCDVCK